MNAYAQSAEKANIVSDTWQSTSLQAIVSLSAECTEFELCDKPLPPKSCSRVREAKLAVSV